MPKIHSRYDVPSHPGESFFEPSMTQQQFKDEADINNIIAKYQKTGFLVDPLNPGSHQPQFGDFTAVEDYHSAQTIIAHSSQAFDMLPSFLRKRFNNNPAELLSFLEDESNREEAIKLGIVKAPINPDPVVVVSPASGNEA